MPRFIRRLAALFRPGRDRELAEEMRFHQEQLEADGASPAAAARAFGNDLLLRERARDAWGWFWLEQVGQDLKHLWRQFRRAPASAGVAVLVLALAIGAGTALFSVLDAALLRPLPYAQPEQLVAIQGETGLQMVPGAPTALAIRRAAWISRLRTLHDWVTSETGELTVGADAGQLPLRAAAAEVSPGLFRLLGVNPVGRGFDAADSTPGRDHVAIVRSDLAARWGGTAAVIGRTLRLDGTGYRVVGVAPSWCDIPYATQIWLPLPQVWDLAADPLVSNVIIFNSLARLQPGVTPAQALADLIRVQAPPPKLRADMNVVPLQQSQTAESAPVLWMLLGTVGLVILIACANVASLQLTQALRRRHETAVRVALGASRGRLIRQHLTESLTLAFLGGGLGCALAAASLAAIQHALPEQLTLAGPLALDQRVLFFAFAAALASGLAVGLAPTLAIGRAPQPRLQAGGAVSAPAQRLRAALVVAEVALAMVLLAGAGLLLSSLSRLARVNVGIQTQGLLTAQLSIAGPRFHASANRARFDRQFRQRLLALPGVTAAALGNNLPLHTGATLTMRLSAGGNSTGTYFTNVSPGYFRTLGIPLLAGRDFDDADQGAPNVVIVSRSLATALWPGVNPVGRQFDIPSRPGTKNVATVIGLAGDTRLRLDQPPAHNLYFALAQSPSEDVAALLRTSGDPEALAAPLRRALADLDTDLALSQVATMTALARADTANQRFRSLLLALFAALALGLAATGLGAALAHSAALRTREIGVRMALGARPRQAAGLVLAQGLRLAALGLALGLGAAFAVNRLLAIFLFGIGPDDPAVLALAAATLAAASLLACWWPARRAARVDPVIALRCE